MSQGTVLITGGSGFIGSHLAHALVQQGRSVRVLDNFSTGNPGNLLGVWDDIELLEGDLRSENNVRSAMRGVDLVYHQGAFVSVPGSIADPSSCLEINTMGTLNVLMAARDNGVRRVVLASTSAIYGDTEIIPTHEALPPSPLSPYAISKLSGEQLCSLFYELYDLEAVVLRYFNVYGPRQDPLSPYAAAVPKFIHALWNQNQPVIYGDGTQTRGFVFVDDVVRANLLAGSVSKAAGEVINIASDSSISINDLLRDICELMGVPFNPEYRASRPGDIRDSRAEVSLAQEVLGWQPQVSLNIGLERCVDALRKSAETS